MPSVSRRFECIFCLIMYKHLLTTENVVRQFGYLPRLVPSDHLPTFLNLNQASVARLQQTAKVKTQQGSLGSFS